MELGAAILQSCCSVQLRFPITNARGNPARPFSLLIKVPIQAPSLKLNYQGHNSLVKQPGWLQSSLTTAIAGHRSVCEGLSSTHTSGATSVHEPNQSGEEKDDNDGAQCLDDSRMIRVCDKLIDVFMVDKPTPTDWRRMLAFSKEWNSIRPHFFARCQDRADSEKNPEMQQKLLRLGRKLKEIDEDVQRHNELLQVIRGASSEITEIVSKRRKDFTKEFFVHLHTVAESYYDNPTEQNDLAKLGSACLSTEQAYDAELKFQDTINHSSLDEACGNTDNPADKSSCLNPNSVAGWLRSCDNVEEVRKIHTIVLKCLRESVTYVDNNLICSYLRLGKLTLARRVFDGMSRRNTVTWTAIINGYLNYNLDDEALKLFHESIKHGVRANSKMFVCIMNLCGKKVDLQLGKQIHASILKGNSRNLIVDSAIVHFYAKCGDISSAFCTFDHMAKRDVVCWTTMITACSQQGYGHEVSSLLSQMLGDGLIPNEYTVCSALKACGENKMLKMGQQLHGAIVKKICKNDVFIGTSLVDMYGKCGEIADSKQVFDRMRIKNTATWTSIISGYARNGFGEEAINLFRLMKRQKVYINKLTLVSVLMACGSIKGLINGREVHGRIIKSNIHTNIYIGSTLVWFYCKCKEYSRAIKVLQHMPFRDVVSWTAIISGCARRLGQESEALAFLKEMMKEGVLPNSFTHSSALKACGKLDALMQGKLIHSYASKTSDLSNVFVGSALIYMYAKCGYVSDALQIFDNMPERNLVSWKSMIMGYARNGLSGEALKLMYRMQEEGFEVDDYIISTVLTTCGGDIERDTEPSSSHYLHS